ncbi:MULTISPECIES: RHS repeat domain-containing protein [Cysteiniphilum]|uniref:RHS repeat domain-containing protein n=1 Tax=Cysteiniphilum TaxID=2056696 RepID=UPI00177C7944|nr:MULTISPECIES: RHS repeat-associated core domain-containing protein [Cysteiniphilum]
MESNTHRENKTVQFLASLLVVTSTWQNVALAASLPVVSSHHPMVIINSINNTDSATITYRYNDLDQLTSVQNPHDWSSRDQTYSQDGDLITAADGKEYTFNGQDQLVKVKLKSGKKINYQYYPNGLRSDCIIKNGEHIRFYYDQSGHVLATENVTATEKIKHSFFLSGLGKDMATVADYNTQNNQDSYYVHQNGDTVMMLARAVGNGVLKSGDLEVMGNQHYDAYGNPKALSDSYLAQAFKFTHLENSNNANNGNSLNTNAANNFTYKGEYQDLDSNTVYLKARDYDPTSARFLSRDSYDVWNHYSYADSDPVNKIDPSGHESEKVSAYTFNIIAIIGGVLGFFFSGGSYLFAASAFFGGASGTLGVIGLSLENKTFNKISSYTGYLGMILDFGALAKGVYEGNKGLKLVSKQSNELILELSNSEACSIKDIIKGKLGVEMNHDELVKILNDALTDALTKNKKKIWLKGFRSGSRTVVKKINRAIDRLNDGLKPGLLQKVKLMKINLKKISGNIEVISHKEIIENVINQYIASIKI